MRRPLILMLLSANLAISACTGGAASRPSVQPTERIIPTAVSSLIGSFVWQTDGLFGYEMLRPAAWDGVNLGQERGYDTLGFLNTTDRIQLQAVNLHVLPSGSNGFIVQKRLFEQNPSLEAWTAGIVQAWKSNGIQSSLLRTLPQARIYLVRSPGSTDVQLTGFAVDQKQPMTAGLTASGTYANLERLQKDGVIDDFVAMVESMRAIPYDPTNVSPPLSP